MASPRLDEIDLDQVIESERQEGWKVKAQMIAGMLETARRELEGDVTPERTSKLRGKIEAYREVLRLREILESQVDTKAKGRQRR